MHLSITFNGLFYPIFRVKITFCKNLFRTNYWSVLFVREKTALENEIRCTGQKDSARGWDALNETSGPCTCSDGHRGGIMVSVHFFMQQLVFQGHLQ